MMILSSPKEMLFDMLASSLKCKEAAALSIHQIKQNQTISVECCSIAAVCLLLAACYLLLAACYLLLVTY